MLRRRGDEEMCSCGESDVGGEIVEDGRVGVVGVTDDRGWQNTAFGPSSWSERGLE